MRKERIPMMRLWQFLVCIGVGLGIQASVPGLVLGGQMSVGVPARLPAVTSNTVLADLVGKVGGDAVQVQALVPRGADPHTFQPTPDTMKVLTQAAVVFFNGAGLEEWWSKTLRSVKRPELPVIELSKGLVTLNLPGTGRPEPDPHLWLDPMLAKTYVDRIRDGLARVDAPHSAVYSAAAAAYQAQLTTLDTWIQGEIQRVPEVRRKLVTFHDAFQYFAKRYGLAVKGYVVASPGKEPSAKVMADLVRRIKQEQIPAVFAEADYNPKILQVLAKDAGVKVVTDLYDDSLSEGPPADTYLNLMRHDVTMIVEALK
jgi:manganese/iron transport system substrate-binding protein